MKKWTRTLLSFCSKSSIVLAIEMGVACVLALLAGRYFAKLNSIANPEIDALWCVISSILVLQATWTESTHASWVRILGSFIGAVIAAVFLSLLGLQLWVFFLVVVVTVIVCAVSSIMNYARLAILTASVIYIINIVSAPLHYWIISLDRFLESVIGTVVALTIVYLFKPLRVRLNHAQK